MSSEGTRSTVDSDASHTPGERYDVAILGGGLAGLTLAIQLKQARPETSVVVLEKRKGTARLAAFKVGESTVPVGAHYFADVVGMREHLEKEQLIKCGLRYFPPADQADGDFTRRPELGPPAFPPHDNYQIDRGLFENKLEERARALGVDVAMGARVRELTLGEDHHVIAFEQFDSEACTTARWVVDASGRASLLKRKLGLEADCAHHVNSAWFRLAGGLDLEDWGRHNERWMSYPVQPGIRQFSTNHLLGEGYWVWLIPLSTGPISIGVCADPRYHPFAQINTFDGLLEWLRVHEPQLATSVENRLEDVVDFLRIEDFAYGVKQTYSTERWSLVGEAAAFSDAFYSPGSDFIAYGNTFTADLIVRDLNGEDIAERVEYFNRFYQRTFEHTIAKYTDTYPVFGNPWVVSMMLVWDVYINHAGNVLLALRDKLTDLEFMRSVDDDLDRLYRLNINMHQMFRDWHELERKSVPPGPVTTIPLLFDSFAGIVRPYPDDDALRAELRKQVRNSEAMAAGFFHLAARALPNPPSAEQAVNPYAVGLNPAAWASDGLFAEPGLTLAQAIEVIPYLDAVWDPSIVPPIPRPPAGPPPGVGGLHGNPPPAGPPPGVGGLHGNPPPAAPVERE